MGKCSCSFVFYSCRLIAFFQNLVSLQHIFDILGMSNHVLKEINKEIFIHKKTTVTLFLDLRIFSRMNRSQFADKE